MMENEKETVEVSKSELAQFLNLVESVRVAFAICAPRFGAGSVGEQAVAAAHQLAVKEAAFIELLKGRDNTIKEE